MKAENAILEARLRDGLIIAQKRPQFLGYLDETEQAFARQFLQRQQADTLFWGGYEEAERKMLGLFPAYLTPSPAHFPIGAVTFSYRAVDAADHRAFLGTFLSKGITRSVIGDILPGTGRCVVFCREKMTEYFIEQVEKVGGIGVTGRAGFDLPLPLKKTYQEISGVVASARIDCLVALLCKISREKAAQLIKGGMVMKNHVLVTRIIEPVAAGDVLSIRKGGRFLVDRVGPETAKGRLRMQCRKCV